MDPQNPGKAEHGSHVYTISGRREVDTEESPGARGPALLAHAATNNRFCLRHGRRWGSTPEVDL